VSETKSVSVSGGTRVPGLLFILFTGLKLGHVIDWSWWWVTAPLWGSAILAAVLLGLSLLFLAMADD
jgi:hypothetical protein